MALNKAKFKELLAQKIDSFEKWKDVCEQAGVNYHWVWDNWGVPSSLGYVTYGGEHMGNVGHMEWEHRWWMSREYMRIIHEVYPLQTEVMRLVIDNLNLNSYFVHISRDDTNLVAYTPSMEYGLADRQVKMTFGKLLRKLCLLFTDAHIQRLEAGHRSELDSTFLVAHAPEEIERVYRNMAGDSGCMRHPPSNFDLPDHIHPSHVYAYAGLGVAYTEVDGRIMSRSVIYDNPDNPTDKRWVRIYGDGSLKRKLELAGYRMGHLQGAKLRALHLKTLHPEGSWNARRYCVPYLDGPGGSQETQEGSYVYKIKGEDCLRVIGRNESLRLNAMGINAPRAKSTSAQFDIVEIDGSRLEFTCAFTGQKHNVLNTPSVQVWHEGSVKTIAATALPRGYHRALHWVAPEGVSDPDDLRDRATRVEVHVNPDATASVTFLDMRTFGTRIIDNDLNRLMCGQVRLNTAKYGERVWYAEGDCVKAKDGTWFKRSDCALLFDEEGNDRWVPHDELNTLRQANPKDYVAVAPNGPVRAVSHLRNPRLVMTLGKRRCVKDWHAVTELYDGSWDYQQSCRAIQVMGHTFMVSEKQNIRRVLELRPSEEQWSSRVTPLFDAWKEMFRRRGDLPTTMRNEVRNWLRRGIDGMHFFKKGEMLFRGNRYDNASELDQLRAAVAKLATMTDQDITEMLDESYVQYARAWQYSAEIMLRLMDAYIAALESPADPQRAEIDDQLVVTANHIATERFAAAA